jgi:hypothetical protein
LILRNTRCAITSVIEDASKNGSAPMSIRRGIAPAAEEVWALQKPSDQ